MQDSDFRALAHKKAFELAYALFRVGASSGNEGFKEALQRYALTLLASITEGSYVEAEKAALAIDYFVKFGLALDLVSQSNGDILISELSHLAVALSALMETPPKREEINLEDILSKLSFAEPSFGKSFGNAHNGHGKRNGNGFAMRQDSEEIGNGVDHHNGNGKNGNGVAWQIRQSAIVERIRTLRTCRMKDIQEILPELSERTLRYDLQRLAEQGIVERIGNGGPATFYQLKDEARTAQEIHPLL